MTLSEQEFELLLDETGAPSAILRALITWHHLTADQVRLLDACGGFRTARTAQWVAIAIAAGVSVDDVLVAVALAREAGLVKLVRRGLAVTPVAA